MKKNKGYLSYVIIIMIIIIGIIGYFFLFNNKKEIVFSFNESQINIKIGEYKKIDYSLSIDTVNIDWKSSNNEIVTIDNSGLIMGVNYGSAVITGKIINGDEEITNNCMVKVYSGEPNSSLIDVEVADGEVLMMPNSEFDIPFKMMPQDAYITSLEYIIDNKDVIDVHNNKIISKNVGKATLTVVVNNKIQKDITVNVKDNVKENKIIQKVQSVSFDEENINLKTGETKELTYKVNPSDALIESIRWESSDSSVVSVSNGIITAHSEGEAIIKLIVNDDKETDMDVVVLIDPSSIIVDNYPKTLIKIGEKTNVSSHILPINASDKTIKYKSSNPSVATVENGVITGTGTGNTTITLTTINDKSISININVLPNKGVINGTGNLWGYKSLNEKKLVRADNTFFAKLAHNGIGVLQGNTYTYNSGDVKYTYNLNTSTLATSGQKIKVRMYYPENCDLSILNTFTYMGGDGEKNFSGLFSQVEKDLSIINSAGIVIFVAKGDNTNFDQYSGVYATKFVQAIIKQKSNTKNSIAGFSTGGTKVMGAANLHNYDRVIVFSSYYNWVKSANNVKNKEVMFFVPKSDHLYNQAKTSITDMKLAGYTNVTIVTNSQELIDKFKNDFLIINPGTLMLNGHLTDNVIRANLFSYAND